MMRGGRSVRVRGGGRRGMMSDVQYDDVPVRMYI